MSPPTLNILFAGTPEFAAAHLQALLTSRHRIVGVYTQPDRPAGRGKQLHASPVKQLAQAAQLPVYQPLNLKTADAQAELAALKADILVVVAYGLLLPQAVLDAPRLGCINVHASLLPRWRGAAPIQRAIEAGDDVTGITIMQMDIGLDTGAMLLKTYCPILPEDTASQLHDRLASQGPDALLEALESLAKGELRGQTQNNDLATYAHKLTKAEALLDWTASAELLARRVRAFNPFPTAFTLINGERLRVLNATPTELHTAARPGTLLEISTQGLRVACGQGCLEIQQVQFAGKNPASIKALLNGQHPFVVGMPLGEPQEVTG